MLTAQALLKISLMFLMMYDNILSAREVIKMNLPELKAKKDFMLENLRVLDDVILNNFEQAFDIEYTHNSTAIEGNTLTLMETKMVLEDKISINGKDMREIYEVTNHKKAYDYVRKCIAEQKPLDEVITKDIHAILTENIMKGSFYRDANVYISGAVHVPPPPQTMYLQVKAFFENLPAKSSIEPIELAAWTHAEFVKIHPFFDGNGRTSRLIMNYQLMANNYLPISIPKERRFEYYSALESYAVNNDLTSFMELIAELETQRLDWYIEAIKQKMAQDETPKMDM
jgi:Fic family protein